MTEPFSLPDAHDDVMAQFFADLERRGSMVISDWKRRHPDLAAEFDSAVRMQDVLGDTRHDNPLEVPARLGGFRIVRRLVTGGMGELYEAEQEPVGRSVVVKIIRRGRVSPQTRDRFLREQEVLAKLHQTNIVPIYAVGEEGRLQYYAMPYIDGAALDHVIREAWDATTTQPSSKIPKLVELAGKLARPSAAKPEPASPSSAPLSVEPTPAVGAASVRLTLPAEYFVSVAQALADVAEAVHHAHGAKILHRDLKPSNVMVDRAGHCWVIDFGLAGYLTGRGDEAGPALAADASDSVAASGVMGTPNYMAPEQFDSKADARSDVWALGVTLYELLTLRRAFTGESAVKLDAENQPALALSQDGTLVAASTKLPDGKRVLVVWEAATGKEIARTTERAEVKEEVLAFSPDNSLLAAGDDSGTITIRPLKRFDKETSLPGGRLPVHSLAFTRDPVRRHKDGRDVSGWLLAAGEAGGSITIWDVERKVPRTQCLGSQYDIYCLAFSPDGSLLASAGRSAPRVWDVATGRLLLTLHRGNTFPGVAFSQDGQFLAVSMLPIFGSPGGVEVYALDYGRGIRILRGLRGRVEMARLSPDDRYLAALTEDWQVGVWDFKTGRLLHVFEAPIGPWADNATLALSNDGRLACASWRGAVLWDVVRGQELRRWDNLPPGLVNLLAFHPSGKLLLFREETEDMRHSPDSSAHPREHPRVCRIRDLLAKDPAATAITLPERYWHVWHGVCPTDGSFILVNGLRNTGGKRESHLIVYDGLTQGPVGPTLRWRVRSISQA